MYRVWISRSIPSILGSEVDVGELGVSVSISISMCMCICVCVCVYVYVNVLGGCAAGEFPSESRADPAQYLNFQRQLCIV